MRSMSPIEGNPWPHDMTISIDDSPHVVMELLWVLEAFERVVTGAFIRFKIEFIHRGVLNTNRTQRQPVAELQRI